MYAESLYLLYWFILGVLNLFIKLFLNSKRNWIWKMGEPEDKENVPLVKSGKQRPPKELLNR